MATAEPVTRGATRPGDPRCRARSATASGRFPSASTASYIVRAICHFPSSRCPRGRPTTAPANKPPRPGTLPVSLRRRPTGRRAPPDRDQHDHHDGHADRSPPGGLLLNIAGGQPVLAALVPPSTSRRRRTTGQQAACRPRAGADSAAEATPAAVAAGGGSYSYGEPHSSTSRPASGSAPWSSSTRSRSPLRARILRRLLRDDRATLARSDDEGGHGRLTLDLVPARVVSPVASRAWRSRVPGRQPA